MNILGTKNVIERLEEMIQAEIMMLEVLDLLDNQLMQGFGSYLDYEDELIKEIMGQVPEIETKDDAERFLVITSLVDRMIPVDNPEAHIMKASVAVTLFSNSKTYNKKEIVSNPFIKNIKIDDNNVAKKGKYELHNVEVYKGEVFEDDTDKIDGIIHIPHIGYCTDAFKYPGIIVENKIHYMASPEMINMYNPILKEAKGNLLCLGLGIGYFSYMASLKEDIEKITIIEKDINLINLFKENILPQFRNKDKIEIINADTITYFTKITDSDFDYCIVDVSLEPEEQILAYLRIKHLEKNYKTTHFLYFDEERILLDIQAFILMELLNDYQDYEENEIFDNKISKEKLQELYKDVLIMSEKDLIDITSIEGIKKHIEQNI